MKNDINRTVLFFKSIIISIWLFIHFVLFSIILIDFFFHCNYLLYNGNWLFCSKVISSFSFILIIFVGGWMRIFLQLSTYHYYFLVYFLISLCSLSVEYVVSMSSVDTRMARNIYLFGCFFIKNLSHDR